MEERDVQTVENPKTWNVSCSYPLTTSTVQGPGLSAQLQFYVTRNSRGPWHPNSRHAISSDETLHAIAFKIDPEVVTQVWQLKYLKQERRKNTQKPCLQMTFFHPLLKFTLFSLHLTVPVSFLSI